MPLHPFPGHQPVLSDLSDAATVTKHEQIRQTPTDAIASGQYAPGQRIPSESELVRRFGASRPTVKRAAPSAAPLDLVWRVSRGVRIDVISASPLEA